MLITPVGFSFKYRSACGRIHGPLCAGVFMGLDPNRFLLAKVGSCSQAHDVQPAAVMSNIDTML